MLWVVLSPVSFIEVNYPLELYKKQNNALILKMITIYLTKISTMLLLNMSKGLQKKYEYSYDVEDNSIDINALLISQLHFSTIVNEVNKKLHPEIDLNIRVVAPKEVSFVFQQIFE